MPRNSSKDYERGEVCTAPKDGLYSIVDALFTVVQRWRVVNLLTREQASGFLPKRFALLDVGCAWGTLCDWLAAGYLYPAFVGIDTREDYLEMARRRVSGKRAKFIHGSATDVAFMGKFAQKFHVVTCMEVLEHVMTDWRVALEQSMEAVRPGGLMVLAAPVNTRTETFHLVSRETNLGHVAFPVHEDIIEKFYSAGWTLVEVGGGYSLMSQFKVPWKTLGEPWTTMGKRLGSRVARAMYMTLMDDPNGGGWYVMRRPI